MFDPEWKGVLLKFGEKKHLLQMRDAGLLYCNTLKYFTNVECGPAYDKYETTTHLHRFIDSTIKVWPVDSTYDEKGVTFLSPKSELNTKVDRLGNVFCLYSLGDRDFDEEEIFKIDYRNERKDKCFLVIEDVNRFIALAKAAIRLQKTNGAIGFVDYLDFDFLQGTRTPFQKDIKYKHESEFRVYVNSSSDKPLFLDIGSMKDYTTLMYGKLQRTFFTKSGGTHFLTNAKII